MHLTIHYVLATNRPIYYYKKATKITVILKGNSINGNTR